MTQIVGGTWSYSGDPTTDLKDRVRHLIRDTDQRDQKLSDEEIMFAIADTGNHYAAAAQCCRLIGTEHGAASVSVGDMSESGSMAVADWMDLAAEYDRKAVTTGSCPTPYLGGSSRLDKRAAISDRDRTRPRSIVHEFERPETPDDPYADAPWGTDTPWGYGPPWDA